MYRSRRGWNYKYNYMHTCSFFILHIEFNVVVVQFRFCWSYLHQLFSLVAASYISRDYFHNSLLSCWCGQYSCWGTCSLFAIGLEEITKHYTPRVNISFHALYIKVLKVRTQDRFRSKYSPCWLLWFVCNQHGVAATQVTDGSWNCLCSAPDLSHLTVAVFSFLSWPWKASANNFLWRGRKKKRPEEDWDVLYM
jgi:hypothetical protein